MTDTRWWYGFIMRARHASLYPPPKPMPRTRRYWLAFALVTIAVISFSTYFCSYLTATHDAFLTNAEDLGIMDQALWSILHGFVPRGTICNVVFDTNCVSYAGATRFAIHFEPILYPISLLYVLWSDPRMLFIVQTLLVACGAYPAFWLARLRLRSDFAGLAISVLYLLYPGLIQAVRFDFHAVTLTASLLLFLLYFMYTRQTIWVFVFALLAMACKEEISLVVAGFGIWSALFQWRWRSGLGLALLGGVWFGVVVFIIMPQASPTGHPLLISRYAQLGSPLHFLQQTLLHPLQFLKLYVLERSHFKYLLLLLVPACCLALLAPWVLVLALPSLALNLLSSDPQMYSGLFQYSAEIIPVLIFATIEGLVSFFWLLRLMRRKLAKEKRVGTGASSVPTRFSLLERYWGAIVCGFMLGAMLCSTCAIDATFYGVLPFSQGFQWPQLSEHNSEVEPFLRMIPTDASVSAQNKFVPHLSERAHIYLFPYQDDQAEYILLDTSTAGDRYPLTASAYTQETQKVLRSGHYRILLSENGYLLLQRILPVAHSSHVNSGMIGKDTQASFS